MPAAKLGDPNARAKCGKCQQVFFLNANLVGSSPAVQAQRQTNPAPQPQAQTAQTVARSAPTTPQEPPTPKRTKRVKPAPTEGMIHDEMDGIEENKTKAVASVSFSDDELDSFLKDNISFAPTVAKSTKDEMADNEGEESWADDLLKDTKPVNITQTTNTSSAINNVDLDAIIPVATPKPKKTNQHQRNPIKQAHRSTTCYQKILRVTVFCGSLGVYCSLGYWWHNTPYLI